MGSVCDTELTNEKDGARGVGRKNKTPNGYELNNEYIYDSKSAGIAS